MNADSISYEHEEDGVWMLLTLDEGYVLRVRVQDCAEQLYDRTKAAIGPWLYERDVARSMPARAIFACDPDESGGYDTSDPKSEGFHDRMSAVWDEREGK